MKRQRLEQVLVVATALCASACADDPVLGERPCLGVLSGCGDDARVTSAFVRAPDLLVDRNEFDLEATRTIAPTWAVPLAPCVQSDDLVTYASCTGVDRFVPGPAGAFWLVHVGTDGAGTGRPFARLVGLDDGEAVRDVPEGALTLGSGLDEVTSDGEGGLLVTRFVQDEEQGALSSTHGFIRAIRIDPEGETSVHDLTGLATDDRAPTLASVVRSSDGGYRARQVAPSSYLEPLAVAAVDAAGGALWREEYAESLARIEATGNERAALFRRARALPGGALALLADFAAGSTLYDALPTRGLVVLEADGALRYAAGAALATPSRGDVALRFASNAAGELATLECDASGLGTSLLGGDLAVEFLSASGLHRATVQGLRTGYYAAAASDIALDDAGTAYVIVGVGDRGMPAPLVCAIHHDGEAECVGLTLCPAGEQALAFADPASADPQSYGLLAPAPGVVIAALAYACVDAVSYREADEPARLALLSDSGHHDVVRIDF